MEAMSLDPTHAAMKMAGAGIDNCTQGVLFIECNWTSKLSILYLGLSGHCGPPGNPAHGNFEGRDFNSGSTITYYCEKG